MSQEAITAKLLFDWPRPARFRWRFFGLVLLSGLVHIATFFLFRIIYPPRVSVPPPAPEVVLLLPTTPENRALLHRIETDDPALFASAASVTPPNLFQQKYLASYETVRTQPRTVAPETSVVRYPPPRDPLAIIRSVAQPAQLADVAPPPVPTRVEFSADLSARAPLTQHPWNFSHRGTTPLETATFLIGVTDRGEARFVFQQHSSGEPLMDAQAVAQLARLDFNPAAAPIVWGMATVTWGDDAYKEELKAEIGKVPSP